MLRCSAKLLSRASSNLRADLVDQVERRLRRNAEPAEPRRGDDLADPRRPGLRPQRRPDVLRERARRAQQRREAVEVDGRGGGPGTGHGGLLIRVRADQGRRTASTGASGRIPVRHLAEQHRADGLAEVRADHCVLGALVPRQPRGLFARGPRDAPRLAILNRKVDVGRSRVYLLLNRTVEDRGEMSDPLSQVFAALADPTRRDLVARLTDGDVSVGQLAAPYQVSVQAISKHLKVLEQAGLVSRSGERHRSPVHLEAEVFDLMTKWIERYQQRAEARYRRLDAVLAELADDEQAGQHTTDEETA